MFQQSAVLNSTVQKKVGCVKKRNNMKHKTKISLTKGKRLAFINPNYTLRSWKSN